LMRVIAQNGDEPAYSSSAALPGLPAHYTQNVLLSDYK
jgi:hypothetical protein